MRLTPGLLVTPANGGEPGQISSLGARQSANQYFVDGLSSNNAIAGGGWPSSFPGATLPSLTAVGTTHTLAVYDAIEEVRIVSEGFDPRTGGAAGAVILVRSKSGTSQFHGSAFYASRLPALGANDWFANRSGLGRAVPTLSDAGVSAGGPLPWEHTFFYVSAERLRLRQAYSWITTVPSMSARLMAPPSLQALLAQFPMPNGPTFLNGFGFAELRGSEEFPAALTAANVRLDRSFAPGTRAFLRASATPSSSEVGFAQINRSRYRNTMAALGVTHERGRWIHETRLGFNRTFVESTLVTSGDRITGADFYSQYPSLAADFANLSVGGAGSISGGQSGSNRQDAIELSQTAAFRAARHELRAGVNAMELRPVRNGDLSGETISFGSPTDLVYGPAAPVWETFFVADARSLRLVTLSGFVQDSWHISPRLNVTIGLRWLWARAPVNPSGSLLYRVDDQASGVRATLMDTGAPLWHRSPALPDPSVALARRLSESGDTVLRASWVRFHNGNFAVATTLLNAVPWFSLRSPSGAQAYYGQLVPAYLGYGFSNDLRLPVYDRWAVSVERDLAQQGTLDVSYAGMSARGLPRMESTVPPASRLAQLSYATSKGTSAYSGLHLAYRRPFGGSLQGQLAYSWSHSIDVGSSDTSLFLVTPGQSARNDRGASDFDVRQTVSVATSYTIPAAGRIARSWTLGMSFYSRTGFPLNILSSETYQGFAIANLRPDVVPGVPLWIANDGTPGGRALNPGAFRFSSALPGSLGRNSVRGFGMWQADIAASRPFSVRTGLRLEFRAEAYNLFNHPQFADPVTFLSNPMFGMAGSSLNMMMGTGTPTSGQSPMFQAGGARSLQLSLRLGF